MMMGLDEKKSLCYQSDTFIAMKENDGERLFSKNVCSEQL